MADTRLGVRNLGEEIGEGLLGLAARRNLLLPDRERAQLVAKEPERGLIYFLKDLTVDGVIPLTSLIILF